MSKLVPTIRTTPTNEGFARAFLTQAPGATKAACGVLWAQFACETGRGVHCYGHNLGNYKWTAGAGDHHALNGVWEGFAPDVAATMIASGRARPDPSADHARAVGPSKVSVIFTAADPMSWFRSYASLAFGMAHFVTTKRTGRYASAWKYLERGDAEGYARCLGSLSYYSGSPDAYARNMLALHAEWMRSTAFDDVSAEPTIDPRVCLPGEVCDESRPTVDAITGETWVLPFAIVRPPVEFTPQVLPDDESGPIEPDGLWTRLAKGLRLRR